MSKQECFTGQITDKIRLKYDGEDRFRVNVPFYFSDGDSFVIVFKKMGGRWVISDEAHTRLHMSIFLDYPILDMPESQLFISSILVKHDVDSRNHELIRDVVDGKYADGLFDMIQAISEISTLPKFLECFDDKIDKGDEYDPNWYK